MTHEEALKWKASFTHEERLKHIRETASSLARSYANKQRALTASMDGPGFVVGSTSRFAKGRNGRHNTNGKRLNDWTQAYMNDLQTLKVMLAHISEFDT